MPDLFFRPAPKQPPAFNVEFGLWLADHFDELVEEYKIHGRFLSLSEIEYPLE